jgi:predicted PurR-regulated permease PerM
MPSLKRKICGIGLLVLGVLGLVLPVLQGGLFLGLGLFVLRDQYGWARRAIGWLRHRWPRTVDGVEAMEARLLGWTRRQTAWLRRLLP